MKVNRIFENYDNKLKELESYREEIIKKLEEAKKNTNRFLEECTKVGIKMVSIGTKTNKIQSSKEWGSFGHDGSIFADEYEKRRDGSRGWPAIWKVSEAFEKEGYGYGCGNSGQHQFDCAKFVEGVYEFREGKWYLIEEKEK